MHEDHTVDPVEQPPTTPAKAGEHPLSDDLLARAGYAAYGEATGGRNYQGHPMPDFGDLPPSIQTAWRAAARQVASLVAGTAPAEAAAEPDSRTWV